MPLLVETSSSSNHWVGSYGPLVVLYWVSEIDPRVCRKLPDIARKIAERQRDRRASVLSIAMPGVMSPSVEARRALAELVRDTSDIVSRSAVLREGQGFVSSVVASVIAGVQMLARPSGGHKSFTSLVDAMTWVTAELSDFRNGQICAEDAIPVIDQQRRAISTRITASKAPLPRVSMRA